MNYDTTDLLKARMDYMMKRCRANKWINEEEVGKIVMYNAAIPKAYGLPKIHKTGIPLRPVIASYESPGYKASKYLANILKNLTKDSKYNVKNASQFINRISTVRPEPNDIFVSFDVVSLFTNVRLDLLEHILETGWQEIEGHTSSSSEW